MRPRFILLGGPNGSGKSSLVNRIEPTGLDDITNPDTIRQEDGSLASQLQAGRIVIQRSKVRSLACPVCLQIVENTCYTYNGPGPPVVSVIN